MSYQVLARKWRPQTFQQVVGQAHVLRALINALDSDRLHHAYLFTGTRGVGKTSLARVFAKSLNCEQGVSSEPCGQCSACVEVDEGRFVDLIEVDAASRTKVDETRELLDNVQYAPTRGRYKVYLIDEVHMFSTHSFNALLKTLEEPPPHVKFLLATTDPKKLPVTILSRCLQFNLKRVPLDQLHDHLELIIGKESVSGDDDALWQLAKAADGSVRDALSLLDQAIAYGGGEVRTADVATMLGTIAGNEIVGMLDALNDRDASSLLRLARQLAESAPDYHYVLGEMISFLQRVAVAQAMPEGVEEFEKSSEVLRLAEVMSAADVQLFYQIGLIGRRDLSLAPEPQAGFEMVLLRMLAFQLEQNSSAGAASETGAGGAPRKRVSRPTPEGNRKNVGARIEAAKKVVLQQETDPANNVDADCRTDSGRPSPDLSRQAIQDSSAGGQGISPSPQRNTQAPGDVDPLNWHVLVDTLSLDGMVRELARNSNVANYAGSLLELTVESQHENLKADRLVNGLEKALSEQANLNVQIKVVVADAGGVDTIAKRMSEEQKQRQREAEAVIAEDPTVQALQSEFGATIESVSPR